MRTFVASIPLLLLVAACCYAPQPGGQPTDPAAPGATAPAVEAPIPPGPGGTAAGSCDTRASLGSCTEYVAGGASITLLGADLAASVCQAGSGTWSTGPCPTANRLGTCTMGAGSPADGTILHYYAEGERPFDLAGARAACESGDSAGTFAPTDVRPVSGTP